MEKNKVSLTDEIETSKNKIHELESQLSTKDTHYETKLNELEKNLQQKQIELNSKCGEIHSLKKLFEQNKANLSEEIETSKNKIHELESQLSTKDTHYETKLNEMEKNKVSLTDEIETSKNKIHELESQLSTKDTHYETIVNELNQVKDQLAQIEMEKEMCKDTFAAFKLNQEQLIKDISNKHSKEIMNKLAIERQQTEEALEILRNTVSHKDIELKEKETLFEEIFIDLKQKLDFANKEIEQEKKKFESVKELNVMLIQTTTQKRSELEKKKLHIHDLTVHLESVKDYANRLDDHYQKKKQEFNRMSEENRELKNLISIQETELTRLREEKIFHNQKDHTRGQQRRNGQKIN